MPSIKEWEKDIEKMSTKELEHVYSHMCEITTLSWDMFDKTYVKEQGLESIKLLLGLELKRRAKQ